MKNIVKILIGFFIILSALVGYNFNPAYMYQLTFISNALCGLLLMTDGLVVMITKKSLPVILYQFVLPCILTSFCSVFFVIFGWHDFNFSGMFFFMHVINPVVVLAMYLFTTKLELKDKTDYVRRIFIAPAFVVSYALFDYIRFLITGDLVYGLVSAENLTFINAFIIGVCFYASIAFMSYGLLELKLYVQKKMEEKTNLLNT
jgi:membrane protein CcdC involved in cytochrome C biogenesis